ncbi:MAG: 4-hydroxythreonine-4-phosphate dehydrogenase PdxA [Ignavibacteriaceae bacterium]
MNKFIFTCGDSNGVGPEIVIKTINKIYNTSPGKIFFACPENVFRKASEIVPPGFEYVIGKSGIDPSPGKVTIIDIGKIKLDPGRPTKQSGKAAYKSIKTAFDFAKNKKADAIITAPISKTALRMAGYKYPGHTEMLAEWAGTKKFVMMFLSKKMNAALITIHEPIGKVAPLISKKILADKIEIIINTLKKDLNVKAPKAAVLGLNPHAGESGLIGREEEKIITPFISSSEYSEYLHGPFSPDAFFANHQYKNYDVVVGMYHDQVLIPFKMLNFSSGVNYTAGLPIVRTSPDHGTAFDIAYKNKADETSIFQAFEYAEKIVKCRKPLIL